MNATTTEDQAPNPAYPILIGLMIPWMFFIAIFTPLEWWLLSAGLLTSVGFFLLYAAAWSHQRANQLDKNPTKWAALAIITLGTSAILLTPKAGTKTKLEYLCDGCGRLADLHEPFCYACGS